MPGVLIRLNHIPAIGRPHRYHGCVGPHRRSNLLCVVRNQLRGLRCREVAVGVIAAVGISGQPCHPVGGKQPQRIPPLRAPRVGYLAAFKDDVIDGPVGEAAAHRESAMAAAQHDGGCLEYLRPLASGGVDSDVGWVGEDVEDRGMLL